MDATLNSAELMSAFQPLISLYAGIFARRGFDLAMVSQRWADGYLRTLGEGGAGLEIEELLRAGCKRLPLAVVLKVGMFLARLPEVHSEMMGSPPQLERLIQQFKATASVFEGIWQDLSFDGPPEWPIGAIVPSPHDMAKYLHYYECINFVPSLFEAMNVRSARDIERHLPTAYVRTATGNWHDREVSAIISVVTNSNLDEGTHRLWRNRSFTRIALRPEIIWQLAEIVAEGYYEKG
jgi:hypothetical protein